MCGVFCLQIFLIPKINSRQSVLQIPCYVPTTLISHYLLCIFPDITCSMLFRNSKLYRFCFHKLPFQVSFLHVRDVHFDLYKSFGSTSGVMREPTFLARVVVNAKKW